MNAQTQILDSQAIETPGSALSSFASPAPKEDSLLRQVLICTTITALTFLCYFFITRCIVQSVRVEGSSMYPTLQNSDSYFLNRCVYLFCSPSRGEIVVLRDPTDQTLAVKRVIGVGGDTVDVKGGKVFLNGQKLTESYLPSGVPTFPNGAARQQSFKLAKNEVFVLGDNRLNSSDGRTYGAVTKRAVLGRIIR